MQDNIAINHSSWLDVFTNPVKQLFQYINGSSTTSSELPADEKIKNEENVLQTVSASLRLSTSSRGSSAGSRILQGLLGFLDPADKPRDDVVKLTQLDEHSQNEGTINWIIKELETEAAKFQLPINFVKDSTKKLFQHLGLTADGITLFGFPLPNIKIDSNKTLLFAVCLSMLLVAASAETFEYEYFMSPDGLNELLALAVNTDPAMRAAFPNMGQAPYTCNATFPGNSSLNYDVVIYDKTVEGSNGQGGTVQTAEKFLGVVWQAMTPFKSCVIREMDNDVNPKSYTSTQDWVYAAIFLAAAAGLAGAGYVLYKAYTHCKNKLNSQAHLPGRMFPTVNPLSPQPNEEKLEEGQLFEANEQQPSNYNTLSNE